MQNTKYTLGKLIELAMTMEKRAYEFYDALEKNFKDNENFVLCLSGIKEDELLHLRVLKEIKASLAPVRLQAPVTEKAMDDIGNALTYLDKLDLATLTDVDEVIESIRILEEVEFDVVMDFVDADEIEFEFTREYLKNETLEHADRIFKAQQCLD